jgi:putative FmdB family regulatory protein
MPLYEYECFLCHQRFERIQKVSDAPIATCPECGGSVRRLLGVPALQFKGSGWYVTDYGKNSGGGRTGDSEMPASSTDSASSEKATTTTSKDSSKPSAKDTSTNTTP